MAAGPLSIKLKCASWQQLATIYKRDLSRGTMFLKATSPPAVGTQVRIDLTLPSASVIVLTGLVEKHVTDSQRGAGVELKLAPIPAGSVWLIESALASESKRRNTPASGVPVPHSSPSTSGPTAALGDSDDVVAAEQDLVKALLSEAESLRKLNPFLVLGIGYEASDADVRAAFGDLTKRYHPDLFARYESSQLRQVAAEIFILIRDAYRKLGDETGRAQALGSLGRAAAPRAVPFRAPTALPIPVAPPPRKASTGQQPPLPRPEAIPPRVHTDPTKPPPSTGAPNDATTVRPGETPTAPPRPHVSTPPMAMPVRPPARVAPKPTPPPAVVTEQQSDGNGLDEMLDAGKFDEAVAAYKVLSKKHPNDKSYRAGVELTEGLRALAARDRLEAAQRFEAALEVDPSNERAARELADMRRQATNERKGLLTRLMGKKE